MVKGTRLCIFVAALLSVVRSSSSKNLENQLISYTFNDNGLGTYSFEYETSDGTFRREDGGLVDIEGAKSLVVRGEYGYIDTEGHKYVVHYTADQNGFQPSSVERDTRYNDRRIV